MNKYTQALQLCVAKNELYREWLSVPFIVDKYAIASNSYILAYTLKENTEITDSPLDGRTHDDILDMIKASNVSKIYTTERIKNSLDKCEKEDEITEGIECQTCKGCGNVEWEFETEDEIWHKNFDCPDCNGEGRKFRQRTGKKIIPYYVEVRFGDKIIRANLVSKLIEIADVMGCSAIEMFFEHETSSYTIFRIDDLYVLIMTNAFNRNYKVII